MKRRKTEAADVEAISEAVTRKTMRFVPIKSADQQAAAMVLRTRALLIRQQTQAINALRGHLSELGVVAALGTAMAALIEIVRDEEDVCLPKAARLALAEIADQIEALTRQIDKLERGIVGEAKRDQDMPRLTTIPGVGAIAAASVKSADPGSRRIQIRPSLRPLAETNAKAPFERRQGAARRHIEMGNPNAPLAARLWRDVVAIALANKMARIIWALLARAGHIEILARRAAQHTPEPI